MSKFRDEGREEGRMEGRAEGRMEGRVDVAIKLLKQRLPLSLITDACSLSEEKVREIAQAQGIALA